MFIHKNKKIHFRILKIECVVNPTSKQDERRGVTAPINPKLLFVHFVL